MRDPALEHLCASAERQGATVVVAKIENDRATIIVEHNGEYIKNSGPGFVRDGKWEWYLRSGSKVEGDALRELLSWRASRGGGR